MPQLPFQRPGPEVELAASDARERGIAAGDRVRVSSNGTAHELVAKVNRRLLPGVVRIAEPSTRPAWTRPSRSVRATHDECNHFQGRRRAGRASWR